MKRRHYHRPVRDASGRVVGSVENGTFRKSVVRGRHYLRAVGGYAFDVASIEDAVAKGAQRIELREQETGVVLRTSIRTLQAQGKRVNFGYGEQVALKLEFFEQELLFKPETEQLSML